MCASLPFQLHLHTFVGFIVRKMSRKEEKEAAIARLEKINRAIAEVECRIALAQLSLEEGCQGCSACRPTDRHPAQSPRKPQASVHADLRQAEWDRCVLKSKALEIYLEMPELI